MSEIFSIVLAADELDLSSRRRLKKDGTIPKRRSNLFAIAKVVNPSDPCGEFEFKLKSKYVYVSTKEKVLEDVEMLFDVWQKKRKKDFENISLESNMTSDKKAEALSEITNEINARRDLLDKAIESQAFIDFFRTSYRYAKDYPVVYYTNSKGKRLQEHLRDSVPNILWYRPSLTDDKRFNSKAHKVAKEGINIFMDIYVLKQKGNEQEWKDFSREASKVIELNLKQKELEDKGKSHVEF